MAISVPVKDQQLAHIAKMARGYQGLDVHEIDGCDFEQTSQLL
jgi:hypothetical protein